MNRRSALGITATTAIGFALSPARIFAQVSGPGPQMSALSAYMSAAGTRALPAEAAEHAKHHLLDTLASMISGSDLLPGEAAQRYVRTPRGCRSLRRRSRCTPDALGARLHRAAILGHRRLAARHRSHREGVRVRRHVGTERRHLGARRANGLERR